MILVAGISDTYNNRNITAALLDRAEAVKQFVARAHRLPDNKELNALFEGLPSHRAPGYQYTLNISLPDSPLPPNGVSDTSQWTLSLWRGEWNEYYCSWNGYISLTTQTANIWKVCGPCIPAPFAAVGCFYAAHRRKVGKALRAENPTSSRS